MVPAGGSLLWPLPGMWKAILSPCPLMAVPPCACVLLSSRDTGHRGSGLILQTSLSRNRLHIRLRPEGWGLGRHIRILGGHDSAHNTPREIRRWSLETLSCGKPLPAACARLVGAWDPLHSCRQRHLYGQRQCLCTREESGRVCSSECRGQDRTERRCVAG